MALTKKAAAGVAAVSAIKNPPNKRKRPDFEPTPHEGGLFIRFDCVAGRVKLVGREDGDLFTRSIIFHADLDGIKTGWLDFKSPNESAIVGSDRDDPPAGFDDSRDGPAWGLEMRVAMPYELEIEGVKLPLIAPHYVRSSTGLLLQAVSQLFTQHESREGSRGAKDRFAVTRVVTWDPITMRAKKFYRPVFQLLGYTADLETPFAGVES